MAINVKVNEKSSTLLHGASSNPVCYIQSKTADEILIYPPISQPAQASKVAEKG